MSDKSHEEGELLLDTDQSDASADEASDTDDDKESSESEQEQEGLDLEDENPEIETPREENKLRQIKAWQGKIDSGKATIDSLPADVKWLSEFLRPKTEVDATVKRILKAEREAERFQSLKSQLEANATSEQISKLNEKYKLFRTKGLGQLDALEASKEAVGVDLEEIQISQQKRKMRVPVPGGKANSKNYEELYNTLPFSEAEKLIPGKLLDEFLRKSARGY